MCVCHFVDYLKMPAHILFFETRDITERRLTREIQILQDETTQQMFSVKLANGKCILIFYSQFYLNVNGYAKVVKFR